MRRLAPAALLLAAACSNAPPQSAEGAYRRGLAALDAGRPRTARIELLNAVKAAPGSPSVRLASARAALRLGDGAAAEAEIERARRLGAPAAQTRHLMAHAWLLQGEPDRAIEEAAGAPPRFAGYAARIRGLAQMDRGDGGAAAAAFGEALAAAPEDARVWADVARFRRWSGELAGAIAAADRAVALDAADGDALVLRGELTRGQYGLAAALPWFDRALELDPADVSARLARAATLLDLGRTREMLADTRRVLADAPGNGRAFFLEAVLAARARKFDLARTLYGRTGGAYDEEPAGMLLAAAIDFETGHADLAAQRLGRLADLQPDNAKARRLLGAALWRQGDARGAFEALRPLADRPDADSYTLSVMAAALGKLGDGRAAAFYRARAAAPQRRSEAALLSPPVDDATLAALRAEAEAKGNDAPAQVALIRALLGRGQGGEAVARARRLEAANPGAPDAHVLAGDSLGITGDFAGAAEAYRRAANIAFTEPVALRLIEALRNAGDTRGAAQVLSLFIAQNPESVPAQMLAANALLQARRWDAAILRYERLRARLGDRDSTLLNNLAWAYSETGDYEAGLPLARKAWALEPRNAATADTLGWILFKSGRDRTRGLALLRQGARG
ncbi:MAG: tetratricopeptide repeat protein [Alphaproteobacteria bacterium]|nr:tetratricopeptide repeat protein [Alphaproteobacteria bacterium]MBV9372043.1 tetratricopeptide repeat protein [Alphaproteobacteria bacterium]MBV9902647.1 tetratricopeptide repeat protein [Alphaproteobacteria bacterium]